MRTVKIIAFLLLLCSLLSITMLNAFAAQDYGKIIVNGQEFPLSASPNSNFGLTVCLTDITNALGIKYDLNEADKTLTLYDSPYGEIVFTNYSKYFSVNGNLFKASAPFYIEEGIPQIDIELFCKLYGAFYSYDKNSCQILVQKDNSLKELGELGLEKVISLTGNITIPKSKEKVTVELFAMPIEISSERSEEYRGNGDFITNYTWHYSTEDKVSLGKIELAAGENKSSIAIPLDNSYIRSSYYFISYKISGEHCGSSYGYYTTKEKTAEIDSLKSISASIYVKGDSTEPTELDQYKKEVPELFLYGKCFNTNKDVSIFLTVNNKIPTQNHVFGEWETFVAAGLSSQGTRIRKCENCGFQETEDVPPRSFDLSRTYQNVFSDVTESSWYYNYVKAAYEYSLANGVSQTSFNPDGYFTVAQALTAAANIHSAYYKTAIDTKGAAIWYAPYVSYCIENGIIDEDQFKRYETNITRGEMAIVFANILPRAEYPMKISGNIPDISSNMNCYTAVKKLYNAGIVGGDAGTGKFRPKDSIKRSEACVIFSRIAMPSFRIGGTPTFKIPSNVNIGDIVFFGEYEQNNYISDGKEAIEWIVVDKKDNTALLLSKYTLDYTGFAGEVDSLGRSTWSTSYLRQWLNTSFYDSAFCSAEQNNIVLSPIYTYKCKSYGTGINEITEDKVFVFSKEEASMYSSWLSAPKSDYVASIETSEAAGPDYSNHHQTSWWLRTSGGARDRAMLVLKDGRINEAGPSESSVSALVRPAIWVYLDK